MSDDRVELIVQNRLESSARDRFASIRCIRLRASVKTTFLFVQITTDAGLTGLGEATMSANDALTAKLAHDIFYDVLACEEVEPFDLLIERLKALVGDIPDSCTATAMSAVEQAMWDIRSQLMNVPLHALLGRKQRSSIRLYANVNRGLLSRSSEAFAERAQQAVAAGFSAIKCAPFDGLMPGSSAWTNHRELRDLGIARIAAIREAIGPNVELMIDCHGRFDFDEAVELIEAVRCFDLRWFEEPFPTRDDFHIFANIVGEGPLVESTSDSRFSELARFKQLCPLPLAGGEFFFGVNQFAHLLDQSALDFIMVDVKHCGGLREAVRIAMLAESHNVRVAPHNPSGPVGTIASAHLASTLSNFDILEYQWGDVPWRQELIQPAERIEGGQMILPRLAGLGARLNPDVVAEYSIPLDLEKADL